MNEIVMGELQPKDFYDDCIQQIKDGDFEGAERTVNEINSVVYQEAAFCNLSLALVKNGQIDKAYQILQKTPRSKILCPEKDQTIRKICCILSKTARFSEVVKFALIIPDEKSISRNASLEEAYFALSKLGREEEALQIRDIVRLTTESL